MIQSVFRWMRRIFKILLIGIVLISASCSGNIKQAQEMIQTAEQYFMDGNYEEAIAAFNNAIEIAPKLPGAYHGLFNVYIVMQDYVTARESIMRGVSATGVNTQNTSISYRDPADGLEGKDILIHDYLVITKIMTNPLRIITKEGDTVYQADYEYEFDSNGRITLLRAITENGIEETRYRYNDAGIVEMMDKDGIEDYELTKNGSGYRATYLTYSEDERIKNTVQIDYDEQGKQTRRTVSAENSDTQKVTTVTSSYTYDEEGNLTESKTVTSGIKESGLTLYEKSYPKKVDHGRTVMTSAGQLFDTEEYDNQFDGYNRIQAIRITCLNSKTAESFLWQTTNYYYYDTIGD